MYTFGDSSPPGVLTLHNLLGPSGEPQAFGNDGEGPSDLLRLLQHLQQDLNSPQLQLAGAGARDFTEVIFAQIFERIEVLSSSEGHYHKT